MKEKVKHANLFQLALKITIGWFLEDILNYQTQISTRRSAKTICWKPSNFVTKTRLCQPAKNLHSLRLTVCPLKIGQAPKKKIHLPTIAFAMAFAVTFRRDNVPPQKKTATSAKNRSMLKKISPLFLDIPVKMLHALTVKVGAGIRPGPSGIFFRGKSLNVGTGFRKPSLFSIVGKKTRFIPCNSQDPWLFFMLGWTEKKNALFMKYGDLLHEQF